MSNNLFKKTPRTQTQRDRWLVLLDLIANHRLTSLDEVRAALDQRGHNITEPTAIADLRACNVAKVEGVYTIIPYTVQSIVEDVMVERMRAAVHSIFVQDDLVIVNANRGAGLWIAEVIKEYEDDDILSLNESPDSVWILASKNRGAAVHRRLDTFFMKARS